MNGVIKPAKTLVIAVIFGLTLASQCATAQVFPRGNGLSLAGLDQFDMYVQIQQWEAMDGDEGSFRLETLQKLENEFKSAGIRRRSAGRDYLVCNLQASRDGNRIAYNVSVEYWLLASTDVNKLMWQNSRMSLVSANRFDIDSVASECVGLFITEWQQWNPAT
ncbi:hypothetical protein [Pseudohongiella spirulinae]|uniref:DUF4136 domain-containing protein n=1 Tax=Pseudohongiella spirulinae TaxID=1249552 RepID=A0A0S2KEY3_9GAMM|nr:hypothetical protein [Pseudohongiella spirulinae]ALO46675.1 hypothetical protein PS2015_2035 [Pseudohongiella spirulinae]